MTGLAPILQTLFMGGVATLALLGAAAGVLTAQLAGISMLIVSMLVLWTVDHSHADDSVE
jgi:hypothetical protein